MLFTFAQVLQILIQPGGLFARSAQIVRFCRDTSDNSHRLWLRCPP